jgi:uncharacterized protein YjiS (DUF1127 family)
MKEAFHTRPIEQYEAEPEHLQPRSLLLELSVQFWSLVTHIYTEHAKLLWLKQRHRTRLQLLELTDEQLKDIGISRTEANQEANKGFWE